MSTGERPLIDGWNVRRNNDDKGQDSCSDRKHWEAGVETICRKRGDGVGADAQDDKSEGENDTWKSQCELISISREARRGVSGICSPKTARRTTWKACILSQAEAEAVDRWLLITLVLFEHAPSKGRAGSGVVENGVENGVEDPDITS